MTHLAALEFHNDADLVALTDEAVGMLDLGLEVVRVDTAGELNLLDLDNGLLLLCFLLSLVALKAVLAVIHDAAYRRLRVGSDEHQIEILFVSHGERGARLKDA